MKVIEGSYNGAYFHKEILKVFDNSQIRARLKEHKIVVNNVLNKFYELNALWFERGLNRSLR